MNKTSPLCSRNQGREIYFTAKTDAKKVRFTLSQDLLDEICGVDASEPKRKAWVTENKPAILDALSNQQLSPPFNRILVEEIS